MKTNKIASVRYLNPFALPLIILYLFFSHCSPRSTSGENLSQLSELPASDIPPKMKIWEKSVIHLEGAQNIEKVQERIHHSFDNAEASVWGTAVFIKHRRRQYLITTRHVIYDRDLARQIRLRRQNDRSEGLSNDIRSNEDQLVEEEAQAAIYPILFKMPSIQEMKGKNEQAVPAFLMGLGKGNLSTRPYTYTDHLAIISLNRHFQFSENLIQAGYKPLPSVQIGTAPPVINTEIFTVGYPALSDLSGRLALDMKEDNWTETLASVPTYSYGYINHLTEDSPLFTCQFGMDIANSGGPVIEDNLLVGILIQPSLNESNDVIWQSVKASEIWQLIKIQSEKDSLFSVQNR